ncbi:MAG TPA: recombination mediator RecR [Anaerolineales bacterium]|nr:recombination mediator RecR [Anaerolineales bacterium]HLE72955.1 recombination mediator RecR [Anaerolineales bacterium]
MLLPEPIQRLIDALSRLPGVGPKTASRLTFHLLRTDGGLSEELSAALAQLRSGTAICGECYNITTAGRELCLVCASSERDRSQICVVEEPLDVLALEGTGGYKGLYHVLGGALSPIEGIGPDDLKIAELVARVKAGGVQEVIVATNPSMEGDATAMYLQQQLAPLGSQLTRLARGLPMGGDLEYADQSTLLRALAGRQSLS